MRRALLIFGACWIALSTAWLVRRWWAVHILEKAAVAGNLITWDQPQWADVSWSQLLPVTRLDYIDVRGRITDARQLAWAVRTCGGLARLSVSEREKSGDDLSTFLLRLGSQPRLRVLSIATHPLSDEETSLFLSRCPHLQSLSLSQGTYTGANFPPLASLEVADFRLMPFSDAGLATLLRCPALRSCGLLMSKVTPAGVQHLAQQKPSTLRAFALLDTHRSREEVQALRALIAKECPDLEFTILSQDDTPIE